MTLPEGYTVEPHSDGGKRGKRGSRFRIVTSSPGRYMATVDLRDRRVRSGLTTIGRTLDTPPRKGRGWQDALIGDAVAHLQRVEGIS